MTKAAIPGRVEAVVGRRMSRAERAGRATGDAIVEMVHLMYQNNTAANFWRGFMAVLDEHRRTPPNMTIADNTERQT